MGGDRLEQPRGLIAMESQTIDEQLQQLKARIQERIRFNAGRYREQLAARLVASADSDWIMSAPKQQS